MSTQEILEEIYKLPSDEQRKISESLSQHLQHEQPSDEQTPQMTEEEFAQYLLAKGVISHIPTGITDEEDDFEPIEVKGEPLSETIIRERR